MSTASTRRRIARPSTSHRLPTLPASIFLKRSHTCWQRRRSSVMLEIFECEQCSPQWYEVRRGIPTASEYATILAKGRKKGEPSLGRARYMRTLAWEIVNEQTAEGYSNANFDRGKALEPAARAMYCYAHDVEARQVGFIYKKELRTGVSPDALICDDGVLEIKTAFPHIVVEKILADKFPSEHYPQGQGALLVTGRKWVDLVIYWP